MKLSLLSILLLLSLRAHSQSAMLSKTTKEILKQRVYATVFIAFGEEGRIASTGTGFYYGKKGIIVTSRHVLRRFMKDKSLKIMVVNAFEKSLTDIELGPCGIDEDADLCLLKSNQKKVKNYFPITGTKLGVGHNSNSIGHCEKIFTHKTGKILKYDNWNDGRVGKEHIEISNDICPGDSGGPIFTDRGDLMGVSMGVNKDRYNGKERRRYYGVSYKEIDKLLKKIRFRKIPANRIYTLPKKKPKQ